MQEYNFNDYNQEPQSAPKKKGNGWKFFLVAVAMLLVGVIATYAVMSGGVMQRYAAGFVEEPAVTQTQEPAPTPEATPPQQAEAPVQTPGVNTPAEGYVPPDQMPVLGAPTARYVNPLNPVPDICENVTPSVVGIISTVPADESRGSSGNFFDSLPEDISPWFYGFGTNPDSTQTPESTPKPSGIETQVSGSGIILTADGYIITNYHVVKNATKVEIALFGSNERIPVEIVGGSATDDIAILKADMTGLTPIALGDSSAIRLGELAVAIGNPMSASVGTVTQGIVSAVEQKVEVDGISSTYIQTDAAVNPGNSGGALVNSSGELIGIVTLKTVIAGYDEYGNEIPADGIGFAIPVNRAIKVAQEIIAYGEAFHPAIGILAHSLSAEEAAELKAPAGIEAQEVYDGSAAKVAGMQVGDIILSVEGTDLTAIASEEARLDYLLTVIKNKSRNDQLPITVWRNGETIDLVLLIGNMNDYSRTSTDG